MKKLTLAFLLLALGFSSSCSKDEHYLNNKTTSTYYVGTTIMAQADKETTQFLFTVKSQVNYNIFVFIEAKTSKNETLISEKYLFQPGETKELSIKKLGIIYDKEYIKSYQAKAVRDDFSTIVNTKFPNPINKFPSK